MIPKDRTSPSSSAIATAIVSAWTSKPKNRTFFIGPVPFRLWLCVVVTPTHNVTHALRIGTGHSILTRRGPTARAWARGAWIQAGRGASATPSGNLAPSRCSQYDSKNTSARHRPEEEFLSRRFDKLSPTPGLL